MKFMMMNKVFLESNILIYFYSIDEVEKREVAKNLFKKYENIHISTQVLFEFTRIAHKKMNFHIKTFQRHLRNFMMDLV